MGIGRALVLALVASTLISMAVAIPGIATFYAPPYYPSACFGFEDQGTMVAAANAALYNNGGACGTLESGVPDEPMTVCRNGDITVKIVDLCPGCQTDQLDISQEAFAMIADPNAGRITMDYTCG